ncbi:hypothetical protein [Candidatus Endomicrobiellum trichonymphae]|uniref:hypothetical protein n=1 Tax=Endomicrobium trichonymphae TaxID=1408204 RepID=UPI0039B95F90
MKPYLVILIAVIFLMTGTGYGSEKIIEVQNPETNQKTFEEKRETLREVAGGVAVFLVLIFISIECFSKQSLINFSFSF